ncbi:MAG: xylulokinase [Acidobacteria bacterium]|nr:xylulokinase [Acidobacteriota bacterium]
MKYWLGLDIGTGGSRALLVDEDGLVAGGVTAPHEDMRMPKPLWAEQYPENWWRAAQQAIRGVLQETGVGSDNVAAVGLSGQMHGLVLLDQNDEVLRPAIIWCDQRCQDQVDWINATAGAEMVLEQTANPMLTGFTAPKLLWVRDHEPGVYEKVRHVLLPKDYIRFRLTGEFAGDVSDSSGTALFDVVKRRWAGPLIEKLGIERSILPAVFESTEVTGVISDSASERTGLNAGTPVVAGAGDQAASAVGNGIVEPGLVSLTIGTSGVVFSQLDEVGYDPRGRVHTFCHAVPGKWHVMGVTQGAGLSLQWFRNQLAGDLVAEAGRRGVDPYELLTEEAAEAPAGSEGLFWLPYLMGERTPHLDAQARGGWIGLTARHTRAHMARSVVEGVSYSLKDCLEIVKSLGVDATQVRASGGGARSVFWRRVLAATLDVPIVTLESQEGSAYGAAVLAMVGSGGFGSVEEACRTVIQESSRVEPDADWRTRYAEGYKMFQNLYPALRPLFPGMAAGS